MKVLVTDIPSKQIAKFVQAEAEKLEREAGFHSKKERVNKLLQKAVYLKEAARRLNGGGYL